MDNAEVLLQLAAMQANQSNAGKTPSKIYVVYNPKQVGVWCEKTNCPVTGRRTKVETVKLRKSQTMSAFLTDDDATEEEVVTKEDDEETEVKVLRDHGPRNRHHTLGIVAAFTKQSEATTYIENFYTASQSILSAMAVDDLPMFEIAEIEYYQ